MADLCGLRVVMIIQSYLPRLGGAEKQLAAVCRRLRLHGLEPSIVTRRYPGMRAFKVIEGTPVYRVPAPQPKPLAAFSFLLFGFLRARSLRPQLLHAHEMLSPSDLGILVKRASDCPLVVKVLRGGKLGDLDKLHHRRGGRARIQRLKENTDIFLTISHEIKTELVNEGIENSRCRFVPNGVDTEVYKPVPTPEKKELRTALGLPKGFLCLYSGRLAPEKGLPLLLEAWKAVQPKHQQAHLLILGNGEMEAELRRQADDSVLFGGYVPEPCQYYQTADLFVLPSETEGLSNAMLEAMACGLPVVATRVGAAAELIREDENGRLISPRDLPALKKVLEFFLSNPQEARRMGQYGLRLVQKEYSLDETVARLMAVYAELMGRM